MISLFKIGPVILEKIFQFNKIFSQFLNYIPVEKGVALHLNKLEFPLPKNALCLVWLKSARRFWRRRFLNFVNVFSLIRNYLSLEKGMTLHLNTLEFPSPKDAFGQVWMKLDQWFWTRFSISSIFFY